MARKKRDTLNEKQRSLISFFKPRSPVSEQFRTIRTNIQYASVDEEMKMIMVTSSGPGEGKSTVIANLGVVLAQQGKKVLLIDADMRKPTAHYTFRLGNNNGLTNVLTKQQELDDVVQTTDVENLKVLTSGPIPPNPAELLTSKSLEELMEEAKEKYDFVLFDTPPVLAVTDAQVLANQCNGVILVLGSGKTLIEDAKKAKELLENAKGKLLGTVLNRKEKKQGQYYYYYGEKK